MRGITTLRITSNREQFMSCPLASEKNMAHAVEAWEQDRGKLIRVYLPPLEAPCGGRAWEIVAADLPGLTNPFGHDSVFVCEHEVEAD